MHIITRIHLQPSTSGTRYQYSFSSSSNGTATLVCLACSTIVEYSHQEGFYRVPLPAARQTPQLGGPVFRTFQLPPPGVPHVRNDASEPQQRKMELWARNCREFCRKVSPPKEGVLRIFSPEKIRRLRPGLNPQTRVPKASTLTSRPPKPLLLVYRDGKFNSCQEWTNESSCSEIRFKNSYKSA